MDVRLDEVRVDENDLVPEPCQKPKIRTLESHVQGVFYLDT